jgi:hypothetical protein
MHVSNSSYFLSDTSAPLSASTSAAHFGFALLRLRISASLNTALSTSQYSAQCKYFGGRSAQVQKATKKSRLSCIWMEGKSKTGTLFR